MDQNEDDPPPFWLQTTTTFNHLNHQRNRRRNHRNPASVFLNTGVLVTFLLAAAILFMFILIPYVISLARQVFSPNLVKSSWNSLNIVLVLFAILCGFLSRREDDQNTPVNTPKTEKSGLYNGDQDRVGFTGLGLGLRRSSSSYPDLRQESSKWRFYDDTEVEILHLRRSDSGFSQPRSFKKSDDSDDGNNIVEIKNVEVNDVVDESKSDSPSPSVVDENEDEDKDKDGDELDELVEISTSVEEIVKDEIEDESSSTNVDSVDEVKVELTQDFLQSQTPPESPLMKLFPPPSPTSYFWPSPSPPPPPPPPPRPTRRVQSTILPKKETNQTFETIGYGRYKWNNNTNTNTNAELPPQSSTSTPKPRSKPVVVAHYSESKLQGSERKKGGVAVTKDFFTSFYNQSKRKRKHKRRSYENLEEFTEPAPKVSIHRSKSTPEFPPPSPPPPPPPPPPPQPQHSVFNTLFSKKGKTKKKVHSISTNSSPPAPPPPPPKKQVKKTTVSKNIAVQGDESPLRPIPPPPPPPPFKLKPWQFVTQGDYVKIESNNNSPRSGYSASEDECSSISPGSVRKSEIPKSPLFCPPSPDVNTKADDFIAMFRAKLTLEKSDSIGLKHGNAGPSRFNPES